MNRIIKRKYSWHNILGMTNVHIAKALLSAAGWARGETTPVKLPNIVFILADDLGYGDVGCYNPNTRIPTPHLDRLAKEGMRFSDGHAPVTVCTPSRYSILMGRYSWRTRQGAKVLWSWDKPLIAENRLTVPVLLKQHGYRTAVIGK